MSEVLHREDVKAALRKRHGTVTAFAQHKGLKPQQVNDWMRGRTSAVVARAVAEELGVEALHHAASLSINVDHRRKSGRKHRQNGAAN
ncbi:helix-turn-helix domain-containing protein [Sphingomonas sp. Marseille-Q8236]